MEKKQMSKLTMAIIIIGCAILSLVIYVIVDSILSQSSNENKSKLVNERLIAMNQDIIEDVLIGITEYNKVSKIKNWPGEFYQNIFKSKQEINYEPQIVSYNKYVKIINEINDKIEGSIEPYYINNKCNYIIMGFNKNYAQTSMNLIDCCVDENKVIQIYGFEKIVSKDEEGTGYFIAIPTKLPRKTKLSYRNCYTEEEIQKLQEYEISDELT